MDDIATKRKNAGERKKQKSSIRPRCTERLVFSVSPMPFMGSGDGISERFVCVERGIGIIVIVRWSGPSRIIEIMEMYSFGKRLDHASW